MIQWISFSHGISFCRNIPPIAIKMAIIAGLAGYPGP